MNKTAILFLIGLMVLALQTPAFAWSRWGSNGNDDMGLDEPARRAGNSNLIQNRNTVLQQAGQPGVRPNQMGVGYFSYNVVYPPQANPAASGTLLTSTLSVNSGSLPYPNGDYVNIVYSTGDQYVADPRLKQIPGYVAKRTITTYTLTLGNDASGALDTIKVEVKEATEFAVQTLSTKIVQGANKSAFVPELQNVANYLYEASEEASRGYTQQDQINSANMKSTINKLGQRHRVILNDTRPPKASGIPVYQLSFGHQTPGLYSVVNIKTENKLATDPKSPIVLTMTISNSRTNAAQNNGTKYVFDTGINAITVSNLDRYGNVVSTQTVTYQGNAGYFETLMYNIAGWVRIGDSDVGNDMAGKANLQKTFSALNEIHRKLYGYDLY